MLRSRPDLAGIRGCRVMAGPRVSRRFWLVVILAMFAGVWFGNLEYRKLIKPDEGRYAEIAREMATSGDWVTPRLNDIKYFEKPALQYWATAAAYDLFGQHQWTARLWTALTGFLGILAVWFAGSRLFGRTAGLYGALVLGSSQLYVMLGHVNTLDMGVTLFMGAGLMAFLLAQRAGVQVRERRNWMWLAWAALGLSVLSKGLIGMVLPGAVLVLYALIERDFSLWRRMHLLSGLAIFLAVTAPWFVAVSLANPEFAHFFFIHEHFERFLSKAHDRYEPWWNFIPILLLGMLPWLTSMFDALLRAWKQEAGKSEGAVKPQRFLLIWAVFIFVFFSASSSKLPSYILPIFPALALLIGARLGQLRGRQLFWQMLPVALLAIAALVLTPSLIASDADELEKPLYAAFTLWTLAGMALWVLGMLVGLYFSYREAVHKAVATFALTGLLLAQVIVTGHESFSPVTSSYNLAQQVQPYDKPGVPFYSLGMYDQTLPFYLKRTFTLVAYQDEMAFGLQQEPQKWLPDLASFSRVWRSQPYALAIMPPNIYDKLREEGLPMQLVARDITRTVVKTP